MRALHDYLQAKQELQQQIDNLQHEMTSQAASFSSQKEALVADKKAFQKDLTELTLKLNAAESSHADLKDTQALWEEKCTKYQQVCECCSMCGTSGNTCFVQMLHMA